MTKEAINVILQFMERVQLSGKEVPAFNQCIEVLVNEAHTLDKPVEESNEEE